MWWPIGQRGKKSWTAVASVCPPGDRGHAHVVTEAVGPIGREGGNVQTVGGTLPQGGGHCRAFKGGTRLTGRRRAARGGGHRAAGSVVSGSSGPAVLRSSPPTPPPAAPSPALVCVLQTAPRCPCPPDAAQGLSPLGLRVVTFHFPFIRNKIPSRNASVRNKSTELSREKQGHRVSQALVHRGVTGRSDHRAHEEAGIGFVITTFS